ncbi:TetR/AcrR family transcriptional regulator [Yinghuangia sp. YIM S09857]|uniref:TetR/AcrR family transcriptional regulator n=1 Tax=Yinghuangia sp. YIM S09857 TaxID=3436929 RepID=UPI003F52B45F
MTSDVGLRRQRKMRREEMARADLLDAAEQVFADRGFRGATLKQVAEAAQFSVGAVYEYFRNKEDLFHHVLARGGDELVPAMEAAVARPGSCAERLLAVVDCQVSLFRDRPAFGRLALRLPWVAGDVAESDVGPEVGGHFVRAMELQARLFAAGAECGEFRAGEPTVMARILSGMVAGYQATDPAVTGIAGGGHKALPVETLHEMVTGAFVVGPPCG